MKDKLFPALMAIMAGSIFLAPSSSFGAYDAYLSLSGISGESTNKNQIVVYSFSEGIAETPPPVGSTGGSSTPTFNNLTITKPLDVSSPTLYLDCAQGTVISKATLTLQDQTGGQVVFYKIILNNVLITSVQTSGASSGTDRPTETVMLSFKSIQWTYQQVDDSGNAINSAVTTAYTIAP